MTLISPSSLNMKLETWVSILYPNRPIQGCYAEAYPDSSLPVAGSLFGAIGEDSLHRQFKGFFGAKLLTRRHYSEWSHICSLDCARLDADSIRVLLALFVEFRITNYQLEEKKVDEWT